MCLKKKRKSLVSRLKPEVGYPRHIFDSFLNQAYKVHIVSKLLIPFNRAHGTFQSELKIAIHLVTAALQNPSQNVSPMSTVRDSIGNIFHFLWRTPLLNSALSPNL